MTTRTGFYVHVTAAEIKKHLTARQAAHTKLADKNKELSGQQASGEASMHAERATYLGFLIDHLTEDEYDLDEAALISLGYAGDLARLGKNLA